MPPTIASARNAYSWPDIRLALLRLLPGREHRGALRLSVGDAAILALRELLGEHAIVGLLIGLHVDVRGSCRRPGGRRRLQRPLRGAVWGGPLSPCERA